MIRWPRVTSCLPLFLLLTGACSTIDNMVSTTAQTRPSTIADPTSAGTEMVAGLASELAKLGLELVVTRSSAEDRIELWTGEGVATTVELGKSGAPWFVEFDESGEMLAALDGSNPEDPAGDLHVGTLETRSMVASDVVRFLWHPSSAEKLAWLSETPTSYALETYDRSKGKSETRTVTELPKGSRLVGWGDWGFIVEVDDEVWVLDPDGNLDTTWAGNVYTATAETAVVASPDGASRNTEIVLTQIDFETQDPIKPLTANDVDLLTIVDWVDSLNAVITAGLIVGAESTRTIVQLSTPDEEIARVELPMAVGRAAWTDNGRTFAFGGSTDATGSRRHALVIWQPDNHIVSTFIFDDWIFPALIRSTAP